MDLPYAVIDESRNIWIYECETRQEAIDEARRLRAKGAKCVVVKVIDDGTENEGVPDIFGDTAE